MTAAQARPARKTPRATQYQARAGRSLADGPEAVFVSDPLPGGPTEVAMIGRPLTWCRISLLLA